MNNPIWVAIITVAGTSFALWLKHTFDLDDQRRTDEIDGRAENERYKSAFQELLIYAEQLKQSVVAIETIRHTNADYAMARLTELAHEPSTIFQRLRDYVAGKD